MLKPEILTVSGIYFNFQEPTSDMVRPFDIAYGLSNICRFSGQCRPFYSVAEHCLRASHVVNSNWALEALLHDASEAYIGDITSPLKQFLPGYKDIERDVEAAIAARFALSAAMSPEVKTADLVMLATERRDLMPGARGSGAWAQIDNIAPLPARIEPMSSERACVAWMARFEQLAGRKAA